MQRNPRETHGLGAASIADSFLNCLGPGIGHQVAKRNPGVRYNDGQHRLEVGVPSRWEPLAAWGFLRLIHRGNDLQEKEIAPVRGDRVKEEHNRPACREAR